MVWLIFKNCFKQESVYFYIIYSTVLTASFGIRKVKQVQKLEKAHQVSLSNGRRFEVRYTKKAEGSNSLPSYKLGI